METIIKNDCTSIIQGITSFGKPLIITCHASVHVHCPGSSQRHIVQSEICGFELPSVHSCFQQAKAIMIMASFVYIRLLQQIVDSARILHVIKHMTKYCAVRHFHTKSHDFFTPHK